MTAQPDRSALLDEAREDEQPKQPVHLTTRAGLAPTAPLPRQHADAIHRMPYVRSCLLEYAKRTDDVAARAVVWAIADQVQALAESAHQGYVLVPSWKGYALFGTGRYVLNHTPGPADPELGGEIVVTLAAEKDRSGGRKVGESRDTDPNAPPIQPEDMVIRMGFLSPEAIDALEEQLLHLRRENFPESKPLALRTVGAASEQARSDEHDFGSRIEHLEAQVREQALQVVSALGQAEEAYARQQELKALVRRQRELLMQAREALSEIDATVLRYISAICFGTEPEDGSIGGKVQDAIAAIDAHLEPVKGETL